MLAGSNDCHFAASVDEALELLAVERFDIALVDIVMPRRSGASLLNQIRSESPSTVVILMTGLQDARLGVESIRRGAFDFINKPFDVDEIQTCVRRAMQFKEMADEAEFYQVHLETLVVDRTSALQQDIERLQGTLLETTLSFRAILHELTAALEARDIESFGHTERVVAYATRLATQLGLSHDELVSVEHGAMLHDIGTIFVSEDVLRKPTKLTDEEWALVRRHPEDGGRLLRRCGMLADAAPIVEQHHERWDGAGYPKGLRGEEIDLRARIFAVADCIDVMMSDRPYSPARGFGEAAAELLNCKGQQFDPAVVDAFLDVPVEEWSRIRAYPRGQDVSVTGPLDINVLKAVVR
jgi:response regulator RpfG family c-di-GMP phosphodiesterase